MISIAGEREKSTTTSLSENHEIPTEKSESFLSLRTKDSLQLWNIPPPSGDHAAATVADIKGDVMNAYWAPYGLCVALNIRSQGLVLYKYGERFIGEKGFSEFILPNYWKAEPSRQLKWAGFSPLGTYLSTFWYSTGRQNLSDIEGPNYVVWRLTSDKQKIVSAEVVYSERREWLNVPGCFHWRNDEQFRLLTNNNHLSVYEGFDFSKGCLFSESITGRCQLSVAPAREDKKDILVVVVFHTGTTAQMRVISWDGMKVQSSIHRFRGVDECEVSWAPSTTRFLLIASNMVDVTNQNYSGITDTWLCNINQATLLNPEEKKDKDNDENVNSNNSIINSGFSNQVLSVHKVNTRITQDAKWSSSIDNFILIEGKSPGDIYLIDGTDGTKLYAFPSGYRNKIYWSPNGEMVAIGGFGNLAGDLSFYKVEGRKITVVTEWRESCTVQCGWSPDGQYFFTASLRPRMNVDNQVKVWSRNGTLVMYEPSNELYDVCWIDESRNMLRQVPKGSKLPALLDDAKKNLDPVSRYEAHSEAEADETKVDPLIEKGLLCVSDSDDEKRKRSEKTSTGNTLCKGESSINTNSISESTIGQHKTEKEIKREAFCTIDGGQVQEQLSVANSEKEIIECVNSYLDYDQDQRNEVERVQVGCNVDNESIIEQQNIIVNNNEDEVKYQLPEESCTFDNCRFPVKKEEKSMTKDNHDNTNVVDSQEISMNNESWLSLLQSILPSHVRVQVLKKSEDGLSGKGGLLPPQKHQPLKGHRSVRPYYNNYFPYMYQQSMEKKCGHTTTDKDRQRFIQLFKQAGVLLPTPVDNECGIKRRTIQKKSQKNSSSIVAESPPNDTQAGFQEIADCLDSANRKLDCSDKIAFTARPEKGPTSFFMKRKSGKNLNKILKELQSNQRKPHTQQQNQQKKECHIYGTKKNISQGFDTVYIEKGGAEAQHSENVLDHKRKLTVQDFTRREKVWEYVDPKGNIQGPFNSQEMRAWWERGYFPGNLPVRCVPESRFKELRELYPNKKDVFLTHGLVHTLKKEETG